MSETLTNVQPPAPMRIIESPIGKVIPALDIAEMVGYDRSSITKLIQRNAALFEGMTSSQSLPTPGGNQDFVCLNSTGIDRLILLMRPLKDRKGHCERVEAFRLKAFNQLAEHKKEIAQIPQKADIRTELLQAKEYAEVCGHDAGLFQAAVFKKHGLMEFAEALKAPSLIHGETGWFIPTQLGEMCALTASQLNHWLNNKGFQYREQGVWRLQPAGEMHGQEYWFEAPSGHREIRIRWRESILYASGLKREIPESQMALPARAGA